MTKPDGVARRRLMLGATSLLATPGLLHAQDNNDRPITLIVPAPPGGTADIASRALQEPLSKALGVPVIVENKGGANGVLAAQATLAAKPDGSTLLMAFSGFNVMTPHLVKLPYDPMTDLQPIANIYSAPQVLVVRSSLEQIQTFTDFLHYAKANPGRLNYASAGNGSVQHISAELLKSLTKTFITHIPYRGTGPLLSDLLAGQVDMTLTTAPPLIPHIKAGRLRPLFVASRKRLPSLPSVPTASEAGLKDFEVASWFALYTHAKAPQAVVDRISTEVQKIMAQRSFRARADEQGADAAYLDPLQMRAFAAIEYQRWGRVIKTAQIRVE